MLDEVRLGPLVIDARIDDVVLKVGSAIRVVDGEDTALGATPDGGAKFELEELEVEKLELEELELEELELKELELEKLELEKLEVEEELDEPLAGEVNGFVDCPGAPEAALTE